MIDVFLMCHRPSVFGLSKLEEDGTLARELDMDLVGMVHTEMASTEVAEDVGVDLDNPVPHSKTRKRIDWDHGLCIDLGCISMLKVANRYDSL